VDNNDSRAIRIRSPADRNLPQRPACCLLSDACRVTVLCHLNIQ
jgi:hypothetical protein